MQRAEEFFSREARACELLASQTSSDTHRANLLLMARHYKKPLKSRTDCFSKEALSAGSRSSAPQPSISAALPQHFSIALS